MSYKTALEKLSAYEPKELIRGAYNEGGCHCVLGAISDLLGKIPEEDSDNVTTVESLRLRFGPEHVCGMTLDEASELQYQNDRLKWEEWLVVPESRAERFTRVKSWLEEKVRKEDSGG